MRDVVRENGFVCTLIAFLPLLTIALCLAVMVAAQQQHLPRRAALKPVARSEFFVNQKPAHIQERNENERPVHYLHFRKVRRPSIILRSLKHNSNLSCGVVRRDNTLFTCTSYRLYCKQEAELQLILRWTQRPQLHRKGTVR